MRPTWPKTPTAIALLENNSKGFMFLILNRPTLPKLSLKYQDVIVMDRFIPIQFNEAAAPLSQSFFFNKLTIVTPSWMVNSIL